MAGIAVAKAKNLVKTLERRDSNWDVVAEELWSAIVADGDLDWPLEVDNSQEPLSISLEIAQRANGKWYILGIQEDILPDLGALAR